jgi:hypothetical protein
VAHVLSPAHPAPRAHAHQLSTVQHVSLVDKYSVSLKVFSRLVQTLEDECVDLKESIRGTIREMRSKKKEKANTTSTTSTTTTPMSTPSRPQSQPHSQSASPTKSALRDASRTPSLASGSAKRKVAFSLSDASASSDDDGIFLPETPSKRPRTTPRRPTASSASAARTWPVRKASSPGSVSATSEEDAEDVEMLDAQPLSTPTLRRLVAPEPVAGPSTPCRSVCAPATPVRAYRTPPSARSQVLSVPSADEEEANDMAAEEEEGSEGAPATPRDDDDDAEANDNNDALLLSRRFRPVFLDRVHWVRSGPRLARGHVAAEGRTRELIERRGIYGSTLLQRPHVFRILRRSFWGGSQDVFETLHKFIHI